MRAPALPEPLTNLPEPRENISYIARPFNRRSYGHEARDVHFPPGPGRRLQQLLYLSFSYAVLCFLTAHVYLQKYLCRVLGPFCNFLYEPYGVYRLDVLDVRDHVFHLSALKMPDEMPLEVRPEAGLLLAQFLGAILPDELNPGLFKGFHLIRIVVLARHE